MSEEHEKLAEAFGPWVRGEFPDAKNIGDVVVAIAQNKLPIEEVSNDSL